MEEKSANNVEREAKEVDRSVAWMEPIFGEACRKAHEATRKVIAEASAAFPPTNMSEAANSSSDKGHRSSGFKDIERDAANVKKILSAAYSAVSRNLELIMRTPDLLELMQNIIAQLHVMKAMESIIGVKLLTFESLVEGWIQTGAVAIEKRNMPGSQLSVLIPGNHDDEVLKTWMTRTDAIVVSYLNLMFYKAMEMEIYTSKRNQKDLRNFLAGILLIATGTRVTPRMSIRVFYLPVLSWEFLKKVEETVKNITQHDQEFDTAAKLFQFGHENGFF